MKRKGGAVKKRAGIQLSIAKDQIYCLQGTFLKKKTHGSANF